jgi:hypothetical protein
MEILHNITVNHYLTLSIVLFAIGVFGVLFRRNAIIDVRKLDQRLSYLKTYFKTSLNRVAFKRRTNHKNKLSGQRPQRY